MLNTFKPIKIALDRYTLVSLTPMNEGGEPCVHMSVSNTLSEEDPITVNLSTRAAKDLAASLQAACGFAEHVVLIEKTSKG